MAVPDSQKLYYSHLKRTKHTVAVGDELLGLIPDPGETFEERLDSKSDAERIRDALESLPEQYKEVFMWRMYAELSFKQIAQIYKKTDNWACVTYHRAKTMIIKKLSDSKEDGKDEK